jgi:hypothetical protein
LVDRLVAAPTSRGRLANGAALGLVAIAAVAGASRVPAGRWWVLAAATLAAVFAWAAAAKIVRPGGWRLSLAALGLPPALARVAARVVPMAEATVPALVLAGLPRMAGGLATALLVAFSLALVGARHVGERIPCGCFGSGGTVRVRTALVRNAALAMLAAFVLIRGTDALAFAWPGTPRGGDLLAMALTIGALAAAVLTAWRGSVWLERGRRA